MKHIIILLVLITAIFVSCSKSDECDTTITCDTTRPDSSELIIDVTINAENMAVPIEVYRGRVDGNDLVFRDTLYTEKYTYYMPTSQKYSAKAYYKDGNISINAIDGGRLDYDSFWNCNEKCYENKSLNLDLKLLN